MKLFTLGLLVVLAAMPLGAQTTRPSGPTTRPATQPDRVLAAEGELARYQQKLDQIVRDREWTNEEVGRLYWHKLAVHAARQGVSLDTPKRAFVMWKTQKRTVGLGEEIEDRVPDFVQIETLGNGGQRDVWYVSDAKTYKLEIEGERYKGKTYPGKDADFDLFKHPEADTHVASLEATPGQDKPAAGQP